jgi:hypothetical protein
MKRVIIILMMLIGVLLSGCVSGKTTYYNETDKNNTLTLYPDGTFVDIDPTSDMKGTSGTYKIDNGSLILIIAPLNVPVKYGYHSSYLLDNEGHKWIKG